MQQGEHLLRIRLLTMLTCSKPMGPAIMSRQQDVTQFQPLSMQFTLTVCDKCG